MGKKRLRDIVIVLPGITGSVLEKNGTELWSISGQAAWQAFRSGGTWLQNLVLESDAADEDDLDDGVVATRVMPDAHIVPGFVKVDGYSRMVRMITDNFEVVRGSLADPFRSALAGGMGDSRVAAGAVRGPCRAHHRCPPGEPGPSGVGGRAHAGAPGLGPEQAAIRLNPVG